MMLSRIPSAGVGGQCGGICILVGQSIRVLASMTHNVSELSDVGIIEFQMLSP